MRAISISRVLVVTRGEGETYFGVTSERSCHLGKVDNELLVRVAHSVFSARMSGRTYRWGNCKGTNTNMSNAICVVRRAI